MKLSGSQRLKAKTMDVGSAETNSHVEVAPNKVQRPMQWVSGQRAGREKRMAVRVSSECEWKWPNGLGLMCDAWS